ncbi:hypothetical protein EUGRSUZ_L00405 [Eucalyptus grandis]|uniref:Uncharacterized protein n=1 Tax=Eucalyptus grandis TaxID=71139 RepID=A0A058ZVF3_EUCGR|nr:hypothetical protein EUGRSUZ_L00405 [Eucalyptus grandis]
MEAGADACFVEAPRNDDELKEIGRCTKGYTVCNMIEGGVKPLHAAEKLKRWGFHLIMRPAHGALCLSVRHYQCPRVLER